MQEFFDNAFVDAFKVTDKVTLPINIIREEDGSSTIEVAVVGKTADDIEVKGITDDGKVYLIVKTVEKETPNEEVEAEKKRTYTVHKIKGTGNLSIKIYIPDHLDLTNAKKTVENGLLTIKIPAAEKKEALEFNI